MSPRQHLHIGYVKGLLCRPRLRFNCLTQGDNKDVPPTIQTGRRKDLPKLDVVHLHGVEAPWVSKVDLIAYLSLCSTPSHRQDSHTLSMTTQLINGSAEP